MAKMRRISMKIAKITGLASNYSHLE